MTACAAAYRTTCGDINLLTNNKYCGKILQNEKYLLNYQAKIIQTLQPVFSRNIA